MKPLRVTEMFYSIQGEGKHQGVPSIFIRLWGCNLHCGYEKVNKRWRKDARFWQCDSIDSWMRGKDSAKVYNSRHKLFKDILALPPTTSKRGNIDIVFTGGEPLLSAKDPVFQDLLYDLWIKFGFVYFETNGTLDPYKIFSDFALQYVHFSCSPKLASSGNIHNRRYSLDALRSIVNDDFSFFKFVVVSSKDLEEVLTIQEAANIPSSMIWLMPEGRTHSALRRNAEKVANICKEYGFNYSDRLHIRIWNKATGV